MSTLCYASGNGEPGMSIPKEDIARQRVDNFAAAFLGVGARASSPSAWHQKLELRRQRSTRPTRRWTRSS
jgi:hypothetical protein